MTSGTLVGPRRGAKKKNNNKKKKGKSVGTTPTPKQAVVTAVPPMSGLAVGPKADAPKTSESTKATEPTKVTEESETGEVDVEEGSGPETEGPTAESETDEVEAEDESPAELTEEERLENLATLTPDDKINLLASWKLAPDDSRQKFIFQTQESYVYFRDLDDDVRPVVSGQAIKKQRPMSPEEVEKAKAAKAKIEKEVAEKLAKEQAAEQAKKAHDAKKQTFADNREELRKRIAARLVAEKLDDFVWAEDFEKEAAVKASIIEKNPTADVKKQSNALDKEFNSRVDQEKKRREVEKAATNAAYAKLNKTKLGEIKTAVLADASLTAADFDSRCVEALRAQRNPTALATWIKWLKLQMYPKMEALGDQHGYKMHFSLDEESLSMPAIVTDTTTAAQLVDLIMRAPSNLKMKQAHVSMETGVTDSSGGFKNPHLYWRGPGRYEMKYSDDGVPGYARWDDNDIDEDGVVEALNAAMAEIKARITGDAQRVIDKAGDL
jgi:hypothetical protein